MKAQQIDATIAAYHQAHLHGAVGLKNTAWTKLEAVAAQLPHFEPCTWAQMETALLQAYNAIDQALEAGAGVDDIVDLARARSEAWTKIRAWLLGETNTERN